MDYVIKITSVDNHQHTLTGANIWSGETMTVARDSYARMEQSEWIRRSSTLTPGSVALVQQCVRPGSGHYTAKYLRPLKAPALSPRRVIAGDAIVQMKGTSESGRSEAIVGAQQLHAACKAGPLRIFASIIKPASDCLTISNNDDIIHHFQAATMNPMARSYTPKLIIAAPNGTEVVVWAARSDDGSYSMERTQELLAGNDTLQALLAEHNHVKALKCGVVRMTKKSVSKMTSALTNPSAPHVAEHFFRASCTPGLGAAIAPMALVIGVGEGYEYLTEVIPLGTEANKATAKSRLYG